MSHFTFLTRTIRWFLFSLLISQLCVASFSNVPYLFRSRKIQRKICNFKINLTQKIHNIPENKAESFYIREARYNDLGKVAGLLVNSFFSPSILVRPYLYLSELQRLQSNFPYERKAHFMFVACGNNNLNDGSEHVIGFVDVDARSLTSSDDKYLPPLARSAPLSDDLPPRPYLSDLAVNEGWRRRGVAKALINQCEDEIRLWGKYELFLRVEKQNIAALKMYDSLGYVCVPHHFFGIKDTTILLNQKLPKKRNKEETKTDDSTDNLDFSGDSSVLDYVV